MHQNKNTIQHYKNQIISRYSNKYLKQFKHL